MIEKEKTQNVPPNLQLCTIHPCVEIINLTLKERLRFIAERTNSKLYLEFRLFIIHFTKQNILLDSVLECIKAKI